MKKYFFSMLFLLCLFGFIYPSTAMADTSCSSCHELDISSPESPDIIDAFVLTEGDVQYISLDTQDDSNNPKTVEITAIIEDNTSEGVATSAFSKTETSGDIDYFMILPYPVNR